MKYLAMVLLMGASTACATNRAANIPIAPAYQAQWQQCERSVENYCHEHAQGDPNHELDCERQARRQFAEADSDAARRAALAGHGCTL